MVTLVHPSIPVSLLPTPLSMDLHSRKPLTSSSVTCFSLDWTVAFLTYHEIQVHFGKGFRSDGTARELHVHEFNSDSYITEVIADGAL